MARRTQKQIEQDYREIREAAKTAESFKNDRVILLDDYYNVGKTPNSL